MRKDMERERRNEERDMNENLCLSGRANDFGRFWCRYVTKDFMYFVLATFVKKSSQLID